MKIYLTSGPQKWLMTDPHKGFPVIDGWRMTSPLSSYGLSICPNLHVEIKVDALITDSGDTVCRP